MLCDKKQQYIYMLYLLFEMGFESILIHLCQWSIKRENITNNLRGRYLIISFYLLTLHTRSHARHAARSTALVQTWMDQSESRYIKFCKQNTAMLIVLREN